MKSDVTVIVPMYNVEKYVSKCLSSLLSQTYRNLEIWAVNDGSPDNSKLIAEEYAKRDNRVKVINKENGGYGSVLEYCIKRIQTKYFLICDPDDWLKKTAVGELHKFAENNNLDIVIGDKIEVFNNDKAKRYVNSFKNIPEIKPKKVYSEPQEVQKFTGAEVSPHAKLFKTNIAKNITFPHKIQYTDTILYVISLLNARRVAYYNKALAFYLIDRPGNSATNIKDTMIKEKIIVWQSIYNQLVKSDKSYKAGIWYYLYCNLEGILSLFINYDDEIYKKYKTDIKVIILKIQNYKNQILPSINKAHKLKKKILFECLMNKYIYLFIVKLYILMKE